MRSSQLFFGHKRGSSPGKLFFVTFLTPMSQKPRGLVNQMVGIISVGFVSFRFVKFFAGVF